MSDAPTEKECREIIERPRLFVCTKCGWNGSNLAGHGGCPYEAGECYLTEKRLARAYMELTEATEALRGGVPMIEIYTPWRKVDDLLRRYHAGEGDGI